MKLKFFEVELVDNEKHTLFALAAKNKRGELEPYVLSMLENKSQHVYELCLLDALEAATNGNIKAYERFIRPLEQSEKREYWRNAKRIQKQRLMDTQTDKFERKGIYE